MGIYSQIFKIRSHLKKIIFICLFPVFLLFFMALIKGKVIYIIFVPFAKLSLPSFFDVF